MPGPLYRTVPREENIERWLRNGSTPRNVRAIVADIERMEAKHGYRYDVVVPWDEWHKPHSLPCCDRECCRE